VSYLRWAWVWLRYLGREKPRWYYGEDQIGLQGLEFDEETVGPRPSPERTSLGHASDWPHAVPAIGVLDEERAIVFGADQRPAVARKHDHRQRTEDGVDGAALEAEFA
jgi:hypothetical protein